jgi:hypothetical protein
VVPQQGASCGSYNYSDNGLAESGQPILGLPIAASIPGKPLLFPRSGNKYEPAGNADRNFPFGKVRTSMRFPGNEKSIQTGIIDRDVEPLCVHVDAACSRQRDQIISES